MRTRRPFTLVELLIVCAIILSLMALLAPALGRAKEKARTVSTTTRMGTLQSALTAYIASYGGPPPHAARSDALLSPEQYADMIDVLAGNNGRGIHFLYPNDPVAKTYRDGWARDFRVAFDYNGDAIVDDIAIYGSASLKASLAIWSTGPDGRDNPIDAHPSNDDNITLW